MAHVPLKAERNARLARRIVSKKECLHCQNMMMQSNRQPGHSKTFHLTEAKIKALRSLAEYFCLCQRDLTALSYGKNTPSTERAMRRTLSLLEAEKLTDWRPLAPRTRKRGSVPIIYGLTQKGVALVT